jgi:HSP20 family protein
MLVTRWRPFGWNQLNQFQNEVNNLFERLSWPTLAQTYPPVNVWADDDHVYAEAELPGMQLDHLEVYVAEGNQLTIQGERQPVAPEKGVWHRQERGFGKFSRVLTLPVPVDADKVEARFDQGVLRVTMPKSEAARPRRITVKAE